MKRRQKLKGNELFCSDNGWLTDYGDKIKRDAERNMMMTISIALGLAIGLSLGILFGSMADDIVRGMTIGVPPADAAARLPVR